MRPLKNYQNVLKGPKAAIYGSSASNGVIAIYLLDEYKDDSYYGKREGGIINFTCPGYSQTREFYQPLYENESIISQQQTVYWNPSILLSEDNSVEISFQLQNKSNALRVVVEGIASDGSIIRTEQKVFSE